MSMSEARPRARGLSTTVDYATTLNKVKGWH